MIKGIGIDLIELERIEKACKKNKRFPKRVLTKQELNYYDDLIKPHRKIEFIAGRFAAKEAFAKAAGTGIGQLSFQDIDILPTDNGQPLITASGFSTEKLYVSISHSKAYAIAQSIITM